MDSADFYVYALIDPRNFEEFYYGKGRGRRMDAHDKDESDTAKALRIREIVREGLAPLKRKIVRNLTEEQAFLVEKTLIYKLGRNTTNIASGHYASNFRPANTLWRALPGFEFESRVHWWNVSEGNHRTWEDCRRLGYVSAGQGASYRDEVLKLNVHDIICAYQPGHGYVGIGRVTAKAIPIREYRVNGVPLLQVEGLSSGRAHENRDDLERCEYVASIQWIRAVPFEEAIGVKRVLYWARGVRTQMGHSARSRRTLTILEEAFNVSFDELINQG